MKARKKLPPSKDAIVDEVRAIRAEISAQFGNDIAKLSEHLREIEARYPGRVAPRIKKSRGHHTGPTGSGRRSA